MLDKDQVAPPFANSHAYLRLDREPDVLRLQNAIKLLSLDKRKAIIEFLSLSEVGSALSMIHLAYAEELDISQRESWLLRAGESGSPLGQYFLGRFYYQRRDFDKSLLWFQRAAILNYAPALGFIGRMYYFGQGVLQSTANAKEYLRKASSLGNLRAKIMLAKIMTRPSAGIFEKITGVLFGAIVNRRSYLIYRIHGEQSPEFY